MAAETHRWQPKLIDLMAAETHRLMLNCGRKYDKIL